MGFVESLTAAAAVILARRMAKQTPIPHEVQKHDNSAEMAALRGQIAQEQHLISVSDAKAGVVILFNITLITNVFKDGQWIIAPPFFAAVIGLALVSTAFAVWCVKARPPQGTIDNESIQGLKDQLARLEEILGKRHKAINPALYFMVGVLATFFVASLSHAFLGY